MKNKERQKKLDVFVKNGALINYDRQLLDEKKSANPIIWNGHDRIEKDDFQNLYEMQMDMSEFAKMESGLYASIYFIDAHILLDYFDYKGEPQFATKTLFNKKTSY